MSTDIFAAVPAEGPHWTIAVRRRNASRFVRVNTIHLTRAQAGDLATFVEAIKPREQAVVVPTWHAERDGLVPDDARGVYVTPRGTRLSTGGPAGVPLSTALSTLRTVDWRAPREVEPSTSEKAFALIAQRREEMLRDEANRNAVVRDGGTVAERRAADEAARASAARYDEARAPSHLDRALARLDAAAAELRAAAAIFDEAGRPGWRLEAVREQRTVERLRCDAESLRA